MIQGEWYDGKASDIFTAGIILFQMYLGASPFARATNTDPWYRQIWEGEFDKFWAIHESQQIEKFAISSEFKQLINSMLAKNPKDRPSIQKIKESEWYNGKIAEEKDLKKEFDHCHYQLSLSKISLIEKQKRQEEKKKRLQATLMQNIKLTERMFSGNYDSRDSELVLIIYLTVFITLPRRPILRSYSQNWISM